MRRAFPFLALTVAILLADAATADAQFRSRGGGISVGFGNGVLSYGQSSYGGQSYYGSGYTGGQSYSPFGNAYGNQFGYPSNGYPRNTMYYTTPSYGGPLNGYGQSYSPYGRPQYYRRR